MPSTIRLSTEELALALSVSGFQQQAHNLIISTFGQGMSRDEAQGRMIAAGHSLISGQLLSINDDNTISISPLLQEVVEVLISTQRTIRLSYQSISEQRTLSYHSTARGIYEYWIDGGITHVISLVEKEAILEAAPVFFELQRYIEMPDASGTILNSLLKQARRLSDAEQVEALLNKAQIPRAISKQLSEDIVNTVAVGDVLDIYYQQDGSPASDQGLLLLFGKERYWIFLPMKVENDALFTILPSTVTSLQNGIQQLGF
jgi:hypothetical protein